MVPPLRGTKVRQPPFPKTTQAPIATVIPMAGEAIVKLTNSTNAQISYQAIGHTAS